MEDGQARSLHLRSPKLKRVQPEAERWPARSRPPHGGKGGPALGNLTLDLYETFFHNYTVSCKSVEKRTATSPVARNSAVMDSEERDSLFGWAAVEYIPRLYKLHLYIICFVQGRPFP